MSGQLDPFRRLVSGPWGGRATFRAKPFVPVSMGYNPSLTGVSRDANGTALGNCVCKLYRTWDDAMIAQTVSDGAGNFTFTPGSSGPYYIVWYLAGLSDVAGTSLNTLVAV